MMIHVNHLLVVQILFIMTLIKFIMSIKKGDANGDDIVNLDDLFAVLGTWLVSGSAVAGDVNNDDIVNLDDLFDVLGHWLQ